MDRRAWCPFLPMGSQRVGHNWATNTSEVYSTSVVSNPHITILIDVLLVTYSGITASL